MDKGADIYFQKGLCMEEIKKKLIQGHWKITYIQNTELIEQCRKYKTMKKKEKKKEIKTMKPIQLIKELNIKPLPSLPLKIQ